MLNSSLLRRFSTIRLTDQESRVFNALIEASEALGKGTVLRAAGGWVRDKLMGNESSDIDIALDNIPGDEFAFFVRDHEATKGHCSSVGVVKENPDQSKHIRTASFKLHGLDLDINNLRSESYAENSRIPEVKFAEHPSEDALRRDFTVNALYYNLNTREVEDYTGCGLSDLDEGIIRTPLPASKTFVDDPLRVLRAIRFAARFGFKLHEELEEAWKSEQVRLGLMNKVSRERIGVEITKMMKDKNSISAIRTLHSSGLIELILSPPSDANAPSLAGISPKDFKAWKDSYSVGPSNHSINTLLDRSQIFTSHLSHIATFNFALLFTFTDPSNISLISRLAMKIPNEVCKNISTVLNRKISDVVFKLLSSSDPPASLLIDFGRLIRSDLKQFWKEAVVMSLIQSAVPESELESSIQTVFSFITNHNLEECYLWKPIVDGTEIQKIFDLPPSRRIQELLNHEFDLMLSGKKDRDEIIKLLEEILVK